MVIKRSPELEAFAREARRRFLAGDEAWFERTTARGEVTGSAQRPARRHAAGDDVLAINLEQVRETRRETRAGSSPAGGSPWTTDRGPPTA